MNVKYDENTNTLHLTVRSLTDLVCRSGDIGGGGRVTAEDGKLTHKRLADGSTDCLIEESLEHEFTVNGVRYVLSGRADGIYVADSGGTDIIEEIKTVSGSFYGGSDRIPAAHIAQGVLYAFMWCKREDRRGAIVRITYAPKGEGRQRSFECGFTLDELEAQTMELMRKYSRWAELFIRRRCCLGEEIGKLKFPYPDVRDGQRDFMAAVVKAARLGRRVLIEAPTGIGKTMASVFPSLKSLGTGYVDRIFYLTQKSSTAEAAEAATTLLLKKLPSCRAVTVLARDRICPFGSQLYPGASCTPDFCPRAAGHYGRVVEALYELIAHTGKEKHITSADIAAVAERYNVCPYELSLEAAELSEVIVCDCNYIFDPKVYFRRFFDTDEENEHKTEKYLYLCDEAHNLIDRASEMYSASIRLSTVRKLVSFFKDKDAEISAALAAVMDEMMKMRELASETITEDREGNEIGYAIESEPFASLVKAVDGAAELCGRFLRAIRREREAPESLKRELRRLALEYGELSDFALSAEHFDKRHIAFAEIFEGDIKCSHICLDPSAHLDRSLSRARAAVFFSATLEPPDYFCSMLGLGKDAETLELSSPYDSDNLAVLIADKISTRLADRETTALAIVSMIYTVAKAKTGNYICYLPSYKYQKLVYDTFRAMYGDDEAELIVQSNIKKEHEREEFLSHFTPDPERSRIGFCVLGGIFSEGVDLPGDRLSGVVIVGVGLSGISAESNLRRDHFDRICERGHEFAYMFPGMNKVLQAAGRVIRGENDRGVVLLIDDRFGGGDYRALFPSHWDKMRVIGDEKSLRRVLSDFWAREK